MRLGANMLVERYPLAAADVLEEQLKTPLVLNWNVNELIPPDAKMMSMYV